MLLGWSMAPRIESAGRFSPICMLRDVSMVSYAGTTGMLLGWSMASQMVDAGRFIPSMLWSRSMVPFAGTTGVLLGWSTVSRYVDTGRFIPHAMLQGVSMMPQSQDYGKLSMLINASRLKHGAPDRGHKNSYFSLMLGLVILAMAAQSFSSCIYAIIASWNEQDGDGHLLVLRAALMNSLPDITDGFGLHCCDVMGIINRGSQWVPVQVGTITDVRRSSGNVYFSKPQSMTYRRMENAALGHAITGEFVALTSHSLARHYALLSSRMANSVVTEGQLVLHMQIRRARCPEKLSMQRADFACANSNQNPGIGLRAVRYRTYHPDHLIATCKPQLNIRDARGSSLPAEFFGGTIYGAGTHPQGGHFARTSPIQPELGRRTACSQDA